MVFDHEQTHHTFRRARLSFILDKAAYLALIPTSSWDHLFKYFPNSQDAQSESKSELVLVFAATRVMTAIFNFQSLLLVILLFICTSTYVHAILPSILDRNKDGPFSIFWKSARIGERLSPYVSMLCLVMAGYYLVGNA